jgi:hypothetical protein
MNMDEQKQLMNDTLEQTIEYLPRLIKGIDELVDRFRAGRNEQAMALFGSILDGLEWVNDAVNLTMPFWGDSTSIDPYALKGPLEAMAEALENHDYTLICDVLDYEIKPALIQWLNDIKIGLRG